MKMASTGYKGQLTHRSTVCARQQHHWREHASMRDQHRHRARTSPCVQPLRPRAAHPARQGGRDHPERRGTRLATEEERMQLAKNKQNLAIRAKRTKMRMAAKRYGGHRSLGFVPPGRCLPTPDCRDGHRGIFLPRGAQTTHLQSREVFI